MRSRTVKVFDAQLYCFEPLKARLFPLSGFQLQAGGLKQTFIPQTNCKMHRLFFRLMKMIGFEGCVPCELVKIQALNLCNVI